MKFEFVVKVANARSFCEKKLFRVVNKECGFYNLKYFGVTHFCTRMTFVISTRFVLLSDKKILMLSKAQP